MIENEREPEEPTPEEIEETKALAREFLARRRAVADSERSPAPDHVQEW